MVNAQNAAPAGSLTPRRALTMGFGVAVLTLVLDQITKWWIVGRVMDPPQAVEVAPFFNLVMVWNRGITFGLFGDAQWGRWAFAGLAMAIVVVLITWLLRAARPWIAAALGLIIGGAIGNVVDRIRWGAVADFLDFHVAGWHWPAFNVADSAIVVGVGLLLLDALFGRKESLH
jgi:signal peptidase II